MRKTMSKASYFDASYQRRDLYEKGPTQGSLRTNKKEPGALSKRVLVEGGSMGVAAAYGGHLKPSTVLSHQGIPPTLPVFDGQPSSSLILWLVEIKCYFLTHCIPDSMRYELAVLSLRGLAVCWYDTLNFKRRMEGKREIRSWPELECHMRGRFTLSYAKSGNIEGKDCMESCVDAMVESNECVTKNPCEEMSHVTDEDLNLTDIVPMIDACTIEHLNTIKVESEGAAVPGLSLSTYLSPLDLYINKRLYKPLNFGIIKFLSLFDDQKHWSPIQTAQKKCFQIICPKFQISITHTKYCPEFSHSCTRHQRYVLLMPHFHSYMLKKMQTILVQLITIPYTLKTKADHERCNIHEIPWSNIEKCFEYAGDLKPYSWVLSMLMKDISISEIRVLVQIKMSLFISDKITRFKAGCPTLKLLSCEGFQSLECHYCVMSKLERGLLTSEMFGGAMDQIKYPCPEMSPLSFGVGNMQDTCEGLLRTPCSSPSPAADGSVTHLVMTTKGAAHQNINIHLVFDPGISRDTWMNDPSKFGIVSTPEPNHQGSCYGLGFEESRRVKEEHKGPCEPLSCLDSLIKVWVWLLAAYLTWKVAWSFMVIMPLLSVLNMLSSENGNVVYIPPRPFLLVFDPGGPSNSPKTQKVFTPLHSNEHEWPCVKRGVSFIHQNLRTNSFELREFDVGTWPWIHHFYTQEYPWVDGHELQVLAPLIRSRNAIIQPEHLQNCIRISVNFQESYLKFYSMKIHFVCFYKILGKSTFQ